MKTIPRGMKIAIENRGNNAFDIKDPMGNVLLTTIDDYFIYFKDVKFAKDGTITGTFLGEDPQEIIDDYAIELDYDQEMGWKSNKKQIDVASLVAIENRSRVIVLVQG